MRGVWGVQPWPLGLGTKDQTISKANYGFLNSPKKQTKFTILSKEHAQDTHFGKFEEITVLMEKTFNFDTNLSDFYSGSEP
jgi:hypothetical protein